MGDITKLKYVIASISNTSIDFSNNTTLKRLSVGGSALERVNIKFIDVPGYSWHVYGPKLTCIELSNPSDWTNSNNSWTAGGFGNTNGLANPNGSEIFSIDCGWFLTSLCFLN